MQEDAELPASGGSVRKPSPGPGAGRPCDEAIRPNSWAERDVRPHSYCSRRDEATKGSPHYRVRPQAAILHLVSRDGEDGNCADRG